MKTINTVGRTTVGIIRHCLLGICLGDPRSATVRGYGVEGHRSLANSGHVVFHMQDNAHTVSLKWGMYLQRRRFVLLFTFVFTET